MDDMVKLLDRGLEMFEMMTNTGLQDLWHDVEAILFHGTHLDELSATRDKVFDFADFPDGEWPDLGAHDSGVIGEEGGIDLICFGEYALGGGVAPNDERLTDDDGPASLGDSQDESVLTAPGGLDHNPGEAIASEPTQ